MKIERFKLDLNKPVNEKELANALEEIAQQVKDNKNGGITSNDVVWFVDTDEFKLINE